MTEFTLQTGALFPEGTDLGAYRNQPSGASRPVGTADATATVSGGEASFTGLTAGQFYRAMGEVEGEWRAKSFWPEDPTIDEHTDANELAAAIAAHAALETDHGLPDLQEHLDNIGRGIFYVENYYEDSDPEDLRDVRAMRRALDAAYVGVDEDPETPGYGFGEVRLHPSKEYVIPAGPNDVIDWEDPPADCLIVDVSRASFLGGRGTRIKCNDTEGVVCQITSASNRVWGTSSFSGHLGRVGRFEITGPTLNDPDDAGTLIGVLERANDGVADLAHCVISQLTVSGCFIGRLLGDNAHQLQHRDCQTWFNKVGLYCERGSTNHGERIVFDGGTFANNSIDVINRAAVSLVISNASLDYITGTLDTDDKTALGWEECPDFCHVVVTDGTTLLHGCHLERGLTNTASNYLAYSEDGNRGGWLKVSECAMVMGQVDEPWFYSDESCFTTGIEIDGLTVHFSVSGGETKYRTPHLVGGEGRVIAKRISYQDRGIPGGAAGARRLVYPSVASQLNILDGSMDTDLALSSAWDFTTSTAPGDYPVRDSSIKYSGDSSLRFQPSVNGNISGGLIDLLVTPGEVLLSSWRFRSEGLLEDGTKAFQISAFFFYTPDEVATETADPQALAVIEKQVPVQIASDVDGWSLHQGRPVVIPAKTSLCRIYFRNDSDWTTSEKVWIDELVVNAV